MLTLVAFQEQLWVYAESTGVTNIINNGSITFRLHHKASVHNTRAEKLAHLNGMLPSFIILVTPVFFLLWHIKLFSMKNSCGSKDNINQIQLSTVKWVTVCSFAIRSIMNCIDLTSSHPHTIITSKYRWYYYVIVLIFPLSNIWTVTH